MDAARVFTVTHPFHPLADRQLEALIVRHNWGENRVSYLGPDGRMRSLPVEWTDVGPADPVVTVGAGRAPFRLLDLLALCALVRTPVARPGPGDRE